MRLRLVHLEATNMSHRGDLPYILQGEKKKKKKERKKERKEKKRKKE